MDHVDGNALAGPLSELFDEDLTTAMGRCAHCGDVSPLGRAVVYADAMGWVARCVGCGEVLLVICPDGESYTLHSPGVTRV
jgi:ribosomal protein S27E